MSFFIFLDVPGIDLDGVEQLRKQMNDAGCLGVWVSKGRKHIRPTVKMLALDDEHDGIDILSDDADFNEDSFALSPHGAEILSRTIEELDRHLDPGWSIQVCWVDDPLIEEVELTATDLAALAVRSSLWRTTRYRVTRPSPATGTTPHS